MKNASIVILGCSGALVAGCAPELEGGDQFRYFMGWKCWRELRPGSEHQQYRGGRK